MNNKIIISIISLIVILGMIFFLIIPLWSSIKELKMSLGELKQKQTQVEEFLIKSRQIERTYWEFEEDVQRIFSALPKGGSIPYLLIQFEDVVRKSGLLLGGITFSQVVETTDQQVRQRAIQALAENSYQEGKAPAGVSSLLVNVEAIGSYDSFKNYLNSLEHSVYPMNIEQINLKSQGDSKESIFDSLSIFQFDLKINTYFQ